jgi:NAD(P)-dependent dehydrogenase (short-subunit alcohol dehydrogenase family)
MELKGQSAIVTGGGSGLGAEVAAQLAASGAHVSVLDIAADRAHAVAERIGGQAVVCDVASAEAAQAALAEAAKRHGPARILINCAGIALAKRVVGRDGAMPLDEFERVIRVNLIGTFNVMRLVSAAMTTLEPLAEGERGVIIGTASVAAFEGQIGQAAYAASKGGVAALTLPVARELAQFGIRVLAIAPGLFQTPMLSVLPEEAQASLAAAIPFPKRLGRPADFADLVLACIRNPYLNGEVIRLDGALRMAPK